MLSSSFSPSSSPKRGRRNRSGRTPQSARPFSNSVERRKHLISGLIHSEMFGTPCFFTGSRPAVLRQYGAPRGLRLRIIVKTARAVHARQPCTARSSPDRPADIPVGVVSHRQEAFLGDPVSHHPPHRFVGIVDQFGQTVLEHSVRRWPGARAGFSGSGRTVSSLAIRRVMPLSVPKNIPILLIDVLMGWRPENPAGYRA